MVSNLVKKSFIIYAFNQILWIWRSIGGCIGWRYDLHREIRNAYKILVGRIKGRVFLGDIG